MEQTAFRQTVADGCRLFQSATHTETGKTYDYLPLPTEPQPLNSGQTALEPPAGLRKCAKPPDKKTEKAGFEALLERRKQMDATAIVFSGILFRLAELPQIPIEFNETLWHTLVDRVTVCDDERIIFTFTDGTEIVTMS